MITYHCKQDLTDVLVGYLQSLPVLLFSPNLNLMLAGGPK